MPVGLFPWIHFNAWYSYFLTHCQHSIKIYFIVVLVFIVSSGTLWCLSICSSSFGSCLLWKRTCHGPITPNLCELSRCYGRIAAVRALNHFDIDSVLAGHRSTAHFSKGIQIANKHMQRYPTSLIIREIETSMKYPFTPIMLASINKNKI